jgi:predicted SnoaL-like aldol condensation-catalyzing enzyme
VRAAVRRFFDEVWNRGNVGETEAFLAPGFVSHNTLEDVLIDGDLVVVRGTDRGTHRGDFMGFPASGREVTTTWIEIFRMEDGKAAGGWLEADAASLRDQLVAEAGLPDHRYQVCAVDPMHLVHQDNRTVGGPTPVDGGPEQPLPGVRALRGP